MCCVLVTLCGYPRSGSGSTFCFEQGEWELRNRVRLSRRHKCLRQGRRYMCRRLRWPLLIAVFSVITAARADQTLWEQYMEQVRTLRQKGAFAGAEKAALAAIAEAQKSGHE